MGKAKKYSKNDPRVRFALWKAYNYREYYFQGELDLAELEVDHIIPESLEKQPDKLDNYLRLMDLDVDFEINNILNYVPTKKYINIRKSNDLLPPQIAAMALNDARKKSKHVEEIIENFDKDVEIKEIITQIKSNVKSEKEQEQIYDLLTDDTSGFENKKYVNKNDIYWTYNNAIKRIYLDAFLPAYREYEPSCLFLFRTLLVRGCMITLNNNQIINQLLRGIRTDPHYDLRGFISHPSKDNGYYIQLGNNNFILSEEETYELCSIIDDFADEYIKALIEVEKKLGTIKFKKTKSGSYKLIKINTTLWKQIVEFTAKNDSYKNNGEWNIFEPNEYMIKVFTQNHQKYGNGYHAIIHLEREQSSYFDNYFFPNDKLWLVWKPYYTIYRNKDVDDINVISDKKYWSLNTVFDWLSKELIPKVVYENTISYNVFGKPNITYKEFVEKFSISDYIDTDFIWLIDSNDIINAIQFFKAIQSIQGFFSTNKSIFLKKESIQNIYYAVLKVLENSEGIDLSYIAGNLGLSNVNSYEKLIEEINKYIKGLKDSVIGSFTIDTALRCIYVCLRDFNCSLTFTQIQEIYELIRPLVEIYNRETLLNRNSD